MAELRELPDNYRPALAEDVPEGRACGNCFFYNEERINEAGDKAWCEKWDDFVDGGYYCNAWQPKDYEESAYDEDEDRDNAIISDIDNTLITFRGARIDRVADYILRMNDAEVILITARPESQRSDTLKELKSLDIQFDQLFMKASSADDSVEFKRATAKGLLKRYNILAAVDDDEKMRAVYKELGIRTYAPTQVTDEMRDEPAPASDQIEGSDENDPGSAKGPGGDIELSEQTQTGLRNKVKEHNDAMAEEDKPPYTRTTYGQLAAVYRRGAGAYSTSHRPGMTRAQWAMARVNAYLYLLRNGKPENAAYITDNDLLPEEHPKSTRSLDESRAVDLAPPAYMRAAARRGLEFYADGKGGDGLVDRTIADARAMASGEVSERKWRLLGPWIARHIGDLDSPAAKPDSPDYPSAGVVAMLLWGAPANRRGAERVQAYAEGVVARLDAEQERNESMSKREVRDFETEFEVRQEGEGMTFVGYAAKFNEPSENLGGFIEFVERGAFSRSLKARNDVMLLWNHDAGEPLASTRSGTMKLVEDEVGLRVEARLPMTSRGKDLAVLLADGIVRKMSFGFNVIKDSWNAEGNERRLKSVRLFEVSAVVFPAYSSTEASVRGLDLVAQRSGVDADALADTLLRIEEGSDLTDEQAELMKSVVDNLAPRSEAPAQEPAPDLSLLALKQMQLDLLLKRI